MARTSMLVGILLLASASMARGQAEEKKKPLPPQAGELLKASPEEFIKRFDKNNDGMLTKDELPPKIAAMFEKADRDGNGKLDAKEVTALQQSLRQLFGQNAPPAEMIDNFVEKVMKDLDANGDGKIARSEAKGRLADAFDMVDTNKDGFLDRPELRAFFQRTGFLPKGPPPEGKQPLGPDFDALDKNADGRLSREELAGTPYQARFAEIDTDNSGMIDRREFESFLKREATKK